MQQHIYIATLQCIYSEALSALADNVKWEEYVFIVL